MSNPPVTVKVIGIDVMYIASAKVYGDLRWLKSTISRLRIRYEGEKKNNEYETKLLQSLIHFTLKATTKWRVFFRRWYERYVSSDKF